MAFDKKSSSNYSFGLNLGVENIKKFYNGGYILVSPYIKQELFKGGDSNLVKFINTNVILRDENPKIHTYVGVDAELRIPIGNNASWNFGLNANKSKDFQQIGAVAGFKISF